ncbi:sulfatase-modifying factor 1 (C-alpha-formyglycine-generating enzyme 1) [Streptococcus pneumoniae]|nr:sulfatase-modifying factor 1 (C-alpha-formyglycine-generating enzyme 1) [Streptococcus pneumoniae]
MKMKKIKGGTFMMGTNSEEGFLDDFEGPQVAVSVKDFSIADTPVTNQEFAQFVKETGYKTLAERQEWSFVFILQKGRDILILLGLRGGYKFRTLAGNIPTVRIVI